MNLAIAKSRILDVVDYPKPGITFKDITPLLADAATFNYVIATVAKNLQELEDIIKLKVVLEYLLKNLK